jgi:hypothetical protein
MTNLSDKFDTLETQLATQYAALATALAGIADSQTLILSALDTLNNNGAVNTRYLLAQLSQLDPCRDCETPPDLTLPVPGEVPAEVTDEHCLRMQALLGIIRSLLVKLDVISNFGLGFNLSNTTAAINEVIAGTGYPSGMPGPSYVEISTLIGSALAYIASNLIRGDDLTDLFDANYTALLNGLYFATTASAGLEAYNAAIEASGLPADERGMLEAVAIVGWFNWAFDVSNTMDTSAYDADLCGAVDPAECHTLSSAPDNVYDSGSFSVTREAINWPAGYSRQTAQLDGRYTHSNRVVLLGDFYHYTVLKVTGTSIRVFGEDSGGTVLFSGQPHLDYPAAYTIPNHTACLVIDCYPETASAFSIEFCPPAS